MASASFSLSPPLFHLLRREGMKGRKVVIAQALRYYSG